jgi:adenylate kinase family enzyme
MRKRAIFVAPQHVHVGWNAGVATAITQPRTSFDSGVMADLEAFARTVVVGNGGSGKSWLAERLAGALSTSAVDLDEIHWLPGGFNARREPATAIEMVRAKAAEDQWVIEGVYGWLANAALPRATALIWLDVPIEECIANVKARGLRRGGDEAAFAALIDWIADYAVRTNANSRVAHERAFDAFAGRRAKITSRTEMAELLTNVESSGL